jgi:hypothetical protein
MTYGADGLNAFGELPRDYERENRGVTPKFALEKIGEDADGKPIFLEIVQLVVAGDILN